MTSFRPFVDPFNGLFNGEITYTTAIVRPKITHEQRRIIEKKTEVMGFSIFLLVGAFIAGLLKWELIYTILFVIFIICLFAYLIIAVILNKKAGMYETIGIVLWQKDSLILTNNQENSTRIIPYELVRFVGHKEGIPHLIFNKHKNRDRDFTSIIVELELKDESSLTIELLYTSSYQCTNPNQSLRIKPLTEQLLKFIFNNYSILDTRALDRSKL